LENNLLKQSVQNSSESQMEGGFVECLGYSLKKGWEYFKEELAV